MNDEIQFLPEAFKLKEVRVRLARADERCRWDELMRERHYLGFKRFAGRHLRYVIEWRGHWLALGGWQTSALKCGPRDLWIGWSGRKVQFKRLHLIANNTRFLILLPAGSCANLASYAMGAMLRRLSDDWESKWGHPILVAEAFVDPTRYSGHLYEASNWTYVGRSKGYSRSNGRYSETARQPKKMYVRALRRDARRVLRSAQALPAKWQPHESASGRSCEQLRTLYEELAQVGDFRRAQGRKHDIASVLAVYVLAWLCGFRGILATAQFARGLSQKELQALGCWCEPKTGIYHGVSKSTLHRVISQVDTAALEEVLRRYSGQRMQLASALAADGKRIRGANRHSGHHHETVTLVEHDSGLPLASIGYDEDGGELAAMLQLLESVDVRGRVITVDALHTVRNTARLIVEAYGADYLFTVKRNASETFEMLDTVDWERHAEACFEQPVSKGHGRLEQRCIKTLETSTRLINYPHVRQMFRITRWRRKIKTGEESVEQVYGITSLSPKQAGAQQLLQINRGHWAVENKNHRVRDTNFQEDACLARTGLTPVNNALVANLACAVIFHQGFGGVAEATRHYTLRREDALAAILSPG